MAAEPVDSLDPKSLSELMYGRLRRAVIKGDFPPGSAMRQEELARRYGASRVPLREALTRLEAEGLLVLRPRRGYSVVSLDVAEIQEIFALRAVIEEHAGRLAADARSDRDLRIVEGALKGMERLQVSNPQHYEEWLDWNERFHASLFASTGRRHVVRTALNLRDLVEPYIRVEVSLTRSVEAAQDEHRRMFDALAARDAERLGDLCRQHCENTAERLICQLRAKSAPSVEPRGQENRDVGL